MHLQQENLAKEPYFRAHLLLKWVRQKEMTFQTMLQTQYSVDKTQQAIFQNQLESVVDHRQQIKVVSENIVFQNLMI